METERRFARERYDQVLLQVLELEVQMGITKRWTSETPEYVEMARYIRERWYHQALNKLQRLVTQRLFELHRLNLSGIGQSSCCNTPFGNNIQINRLQSSYSSCKITPNSMQGNSQCHRCLQPGRTFT